MTGYSGTPLFRKLGIPAGAAVLLDGAPDGFAIDDLPERVRLHHRPAAGPYEVILCFCPDQTRLRARWPVLHSRTTPAGALWIAWPKTRATRRSGPSQRSQRASGMQTDINENVVREYALAHGRVDVKVCAIDEIWSGLKNVIRKADR